MDDRDSFDQFEGLPLELSWAAQQLGADHIGPGHSSLPSSLYHGHGVQVSREPMAQNLPLSYTGGIPSSSYGHQQQMPSMQSHQSIQPSISKSVNSSISLQPVHNAERSAWGHLYSLDPSLSNLGLEPDQAMRLAHSRYESSDSQLPQKQHDTLSQNRSGLNSSQLTLPTSSFPSLHTEFQNYSHSNPLNNQLNEPMSHMSTTNKFNQSRKSESNPMLKTLTVDTDVPLLQHSSYSPVSPPVPEQTSATSFTSSLLQHQVPDMRKTSQPHEAASLPFSQPMMSFQSPVQGPSLLPTVGNSRISLSSVVPNNPNLNQAAAPQTPNTLDLRQSAQRVPTDSISLSDGPIDMSTPFKLRNTNEKLDNKTDKQEHEKRHFLVDTSENPNNERTPDLQSLLSKPNFLENHNIEGKGNDDTGIKTHSNQNTALLQLPGKQTKGVLKKSNFYGRDASLFSLPTDSPSTLENSQASLEMQSNAGFDTSKEDKAIPAGLSSPTVEKTDSNDSYDFFKSGLGNETFEEMDIIPLDHVENKEEDDDDLGFEIETEKPKESFDSNEDFSFIDKSSDIGHNEEHCADTFIEACTTNESNKDLNQDKTIVRDIDNNESLNEIKTIDQTNDDSNDTIIDEDESKSIKEKSYEATDEDIAFHDVLSVSVRGKKGKKGRGGSTTAPRRQRGGKRGGRRGGGATRGTTRGGKAKSKKGKLNEENKFKDEINANGASKETKSDGKPEISNEDSTSEIKSEEEESSQDEAITSVEDKFAETIEAAIKLAVEESSEGSSRRVSSRKSKANAMRLIELQAESGYNGATQTTSAEQTKPVPSAVNQRVGRKRKLKEKVQNKSLEDLPDSLSEDELSEEEEKDDKDNDYCVDEEEAAGAAKEEEMDVDQKVLKKTKEKKSLKISIKIGSGSNAEIVSNSEEEMPKKKKRKVEKVKTPKKVLKNVKKVEEEIIDDWSDEDEKLENPASENSINKTDAKAVLNEGEDNHKEKIDKEKHKDKATHLEQECDKSNMKPVSLMEKYFSIANSASAAKQAQKVIIPMKKGHNKHPPKKIKSSSSKPDSLKSLDKQKDLKVKNKDSDIKKDDNNGSETEIPKFVCGYCPRRYHNKQELLAHVEDHMNEMDNDERKSKNGKKDSKKDSQVESEKGDDKTPTTDMSKGSSTAIKDKIKCGECGLLFTSKPDLLEHVRIHAADKPFECDICHKFFKERNMLSVHRKIHVQDGLHRCNMCSKGFAHKSDLDSHMQSHPKRSGNTTLVSKKASAPSNSKNLDKVKSNKDKNIVEKAVKPASFALALGGESDSLVLTKKKEQPSSNKSTDESVARSKSVSNKIVEKLKPSVSDSRQPYEKNETNFKIKEMTITEEDRLSGVCICNECHECVTRFLANYDS